METISKGIVGFCYFVSGASLIWAAFEMCKKA